MSKTKNNMSSSSFVFLLSLCSHSEHQLQVLESAQAPNVFHIYHRLNGEYRYQDQTPFNQAHNFTSLLLLPFDLRMKLTEFLQRSEKHSFLRTCKSNLNSCRLYIHRLISTKFQYLLSLRHSRINVNHLLSIPLIDTITINPMSMAIYFGLLNTSCMSSKFIGIDKITGNAFLSFRMKRVAVFRQPWRIITFVFNATGIVCIYLSDTLTLASLTDPYMKLDFTLSDETAGIETVLLKGKISGMVDGERDVWCLFDQWESNMFWVRVRSIFECPCKTRGQRRNCLLVCYLFWDFLWSTRA